jgi:hypothetical protein
MNKTLKLTLKSDTVDLLAAFMLKYFSYIIDDNRLKKELVNIAGKLAAASFTSAVSGSDSWDDDLCPSWPPWTPPSPCWWWVNYPTPGTPPNPCLWFGFYGPTPYPWRKLIGFGPDPVDFTFTNVFSETDRRKYLSEVIINLSRNISNKKYANELKKVGQKLTK